MWQNWLSGILGLIIILMILAGIPPYLKHIIIGFLSFIAAMLSFWSASLHASGKNEEIQSGSPDTPVS